MTTGQKVGVGFIIGGLALFFLAISTNGGGISFLFLFVFVGLGIFMIFAARRTTYQGSATSQSAFPQKAERIKASQIVSTTVLAIFLVFIVGMFQSAFSGHSVDQSIICIFFPTMLLIGIFLFGWVRNSSR